MLDVSHMFLILMLCSSGASSYVNRNDTQDTIIAPGFEYCSNRTLHVGSVGNSEDFDVFNSNNVFETRERRQTKIKLVPTAYTIKQQRAILDLHNNYRSIVDPPASNMRFMNWSERAASYAQEWANTCHWGHGRPDSAEGFLMGQNLYLGGDSNGLVATQLWFDERVDYDFKTNMCEPAKQCGHYTAIAWATSVSLGCGFAFCPSLKDRYYVVCHYTPPGNYIGSKPYEVGEACSQCNDVSPGFMCYNNSCITRVDCVAKKYPCECNLKCKNCGLYRAEDCSCSCADGWDTADCSKPCMNTHEWCGKSPGFPNYELSCGQESVKYTHCRRMCRMCRAVGDPPPAGRNPRLCCSGRICDLGYVLNDQCECELLCAECGGGGAGLVKLSGQLMMLPLLFSILQLTRNQ